MIPAGLSSATLRAFQSTLITHHEIDVHVSIQDLSGNTLALVRDRLIDGQVNVDADADVTRSATVTLLDPDRSLPFDSNAPADGALYLDRMIQIVYYVLVGGVWVGTPVFTGPVTKLSRSDAVVNVEAQGKETLAMGGVWTPISLHTGTRKTSAIVSLLQSRAGENRFSIPDLPSKMPGPITLGRAEPSWPTALRLARSLNRQLFYDGSGVCRLRTFPATSTYVFSDLTNITARPQIGYTTSSEDFANTVIVNGQAPKGPATAGAMVMNRPTHTAVAPASHSLSPIRLGRNGVPRHLVKVIEDDTINSTPAATALANSTLATALLQAVDASFESLPIPHLEPLDVCTMVSGAGSTTFPLRQFSLPLVAGASMSVGWVKNLSVRARRMNSQMVRA